MNRLTGIIPVRQGSERCPGKNTRPFCDTSLLRLKILRLQEANCLDEIVVSSDCPVALEVARACGVSVHERRAQFATSECAHGDWVENLAQEVEGGDHLVFVPAVAPLLSAEVIAEFVSSYRRSDFAACVSVSRRSKFFMDAEGAPLNYGAPSSKDTFSSQCLPPLLEVTWGLAACPRKEILASRCMFGFAPAVFPVDAIEAIDIDDPHEFLVAELLHDAQLHGERRCAQLLRQRTTAPVQLLDCTIRDGGFANQWRFPMAQVVDCFRAASAAGFAYFEIGFRHQEDGRTDRGPWYYCAEADVARVARLVEGGCRIAVMAKLGCVTLSEFVPKSESCVDLVRVHVSRDARPLDPATLAAARRLCAGLLHLGYEVTLNVSCAHSLSAEEMRGVASAARGLSLKCLYLADTYGSLTVRTLLEKVHLCYDALDSCNAVIPVGLHLHNNAGDASDKARAGLFHGCQMMDASIGGMARGAGNLKTEDLLVALLRDKPDTLRSRLGAVAEYSSKYVLTKEEALRLGSAPHVYYHASSALGLHPDYVPLLLARGNRSTATEDIDALFALAARLRDEQLSGFHPHLLETPALQLAPDSSAQESPRS